MKVKVIDKLDILPSGEFILVKVDKDDDEVKTAGGVIIPTYALENKKTHTGVIVAIGEGRRPVQPIASSIEEYPKAPMDADVGERILFAAFIGYPLVIQGVEHVIIKINDIMARVHEEFHYLEGKDAEGIEVDKEVL